MLSRSREGVPDSAVRIMRRWRLSSGLFLVSARTINYAGPETYCDSTGNCATRNVTLTAGRGFDGLTGIGSVGKIFIRTMSRF